MFEHIVIEPTTECNINCLGCARDISPCTMSMDTFINILQRLKEWGNTKHIDFYWRGESTLKLHLPEMVDVASKLGIYTCLSTNTSTLHREEYVKKLLKNLDWINLCVDGYNQETIEKSRRGISFENVLKGVQVVGRIKTNTLKVMKVLMFKWNDGKEDYYRNLAGENNIDLISFAAPFVYYDSMTINENAVDKYLSSKSCYRRYEKKDNNTFIPKLSSSCQFDIMRNPVIIGDGKIITCPYDRYIKFSAGNITTDSLEVIIEKMKNIQPLMRDRKLSVCKENCFSTDAQTEFREFAGPKLKVLQKLCFSSIAKSKNIGTFSRRFKKVGSTLKSIYIHKKEVK